MAARRKASALTEVLTFIIVSAIARKLPKVEPGSVWRHEQPE